MPEFGNYSELERAAAKNFEKLSKKAETQFNHLAEQAEIKINRLAHDAEYGLRNGLHRVDQVITTRHKSGNPAIFLVPLLPLAIAFGGIALSKSEKHNDEVNAAQQNILDARAEAERARAEAEQAKAELLKLQLEKAKQH